MNRERLERLVVLLRSPLPESIVEFNMGTFLSERACGFAACAVGLACMDPELNKQGLYFDFNLHSVRNTETRGDEIDDFTHAGDFFGLHGEELYILFSSMYYGEAETYYNPSKEEVADRIQMLLDEGSEALIEKYGTYR